MAGFAGQIEMLPFEFEIGLLMVKGRTIEMDNIGLASLMLTMTAIAFPLPDTGNPAMKTFLFLHIGAYQLVTVETKLPLPGLIKAQMTFLAVILKFCVPADEISG